ncbi:MAG: glutamate formimidoyltransferase [Deltaproteobacteria bacterium]|nr:glutamate formimidoyltransferase [Deltaproteobacteria bacterium]MBW2532837.1 glutamate formimidoyltransferase [Deltaproteobacteria bacterium]
MKLVECVPNFSEGRDKRAIDALVSVVEAVDGCRILDCDPGADTNRTVLTFVGAPEAVVEGAFQLIKRAPEHIDMRKQHGAHARHGAVDVCPFVPVAGVTMEDCADLARQLGKRVGEELGIPVYLYEHAASRPEWRNLAVVRKGEYEALPQKLVDPAWKPDFGPAEWNDAIARSGVVTIGAREFLIAYNINLATRDKRHAMDMAFEIRETGRSKRTGNIHPDYFRGEILRFYPSKGIFPCGLCDHVAKTWDELGAHYQGEHDAKVEDHMSSFVRDPAKLEGKPVWKPGLFDNCKAIGWIIDDYGCAQITMNLTNYKVTPPHLVLEACREMARDRGLVITGSEIVGVIPYQAMLEAGHYYLKRHGGSTALPWRDVLEVAKKSMKLDDVAPFDIDKKVLGLPERPKSCLMALSTRDFVDEISRESPAPGGGSVAALCGAIAAALASMVSNLTINKEGYEEVWQRLDEIAGRAQEIQLQLIRSVDTDTDAFNSVIAAQRMPTGTSEEKKARLAAIQQGYKDASKVPLSTARLCFEAIQIAAEVAKKGNEPSLSDAGVAALVGCAGVEGAVYNVRINLPAIKDADFCAEMERDLDQLVADARKLRDEVDRFVLEQIKPS